MKRSLFNNYIQGIKVSPTNAWRVSVLSMLAYSIVSLTIGFSSGLFELGVLKSNIAWFLPVALFVFPSFLEESVFRGLVIPNNARERGTGYVVMITIVSSILFVLWHPLNALTINPGARELFLNPYFLVIAFFLGISCAVSYIYSRSLWAPVIIHWLTVVVWVFFLGGRNLILEQ